MTYVERILRMQAEVAAELQPEADEALTVYHWSARVRPEAGTQDKPACGYADAGQARKGGRRGAAFAGAAGA